ncbi:MAG: thiamine diphosphokinase [Bacillota bacterium]|jgi:thiamine pyrophosphokinase
MARAVVFSNGEYSDLAGVKARLQPGDWLVAADGAFAKVLSMDLVPDLMVGDFDSLPPSYLQQADQLGIRRLTLPAEKDHTDTDLALQEAIAAGFREILLVGAFGGRLDHALANLFILPPYVRQGVNIGLTDGRTDVYLVQDQLTLRGSRDRLVSLLPLTEQVKGVTLTGFYYSLSNRTLRWGDSIGISNIPLQDEVSIQLADGILLVIVTDAD